MQTLEITSVTKSNTAVCYSLMHIFSVSSRYVVIRLFCFDDLKIKLEIRSVERNICPIATSTMNELFL